MATATVTFRCGNHVKHGMGAGSSSAVDGNETERHAERQAYRSARKQLQPWHDQNQANFAPASTTVDIIINVDQAVCPSCQLWMIAGVLRDIQKFPFALRTARLFVKVKNLNEMQVTRDNIWPVDIGQAMGNPAEREAFFSEGARPKSQLDWLKRKGKDNSMSGRT